MNLIELITYDEEKNFVNADMIVRIAPDIANFAEIYFLNGKSLVVRHTPEEVREIVNRKSDVPLRLYELTRTIQRLDFSLREAHDLEQ